MDESFVKKFLKGLFSSSSGTLGSVLFHFLSIMLIVKYTPSYDFGLYMLILAIVHGLRILNGLGLDLTLVKFISGEEGRSEQSKTFSTIIVTRVVVSAIIGLIIYLFGRYIGSFFDKGVESIIVYLPILCILSSLKELLYHLLQGLYLFKKYAIINVLSAIFKFVVIFLLTIFVELSLTELVYTEILALVACLGMQYFAVPKKGYNWLKVNVATFKRVISFGFPLYLNNILTFVYERAGIFFIGILLDPVSIAFYSVATKIPEGFYRLFSSFVAVYFPSQSKLFEDKKFDLAQNFMNKSLIFLSIGSILLALIAFLFREAIIGLIFTEEYIEASMAFALIMVNLQITIISYTMGYSLVSAGYSSLPYKINTVASLIKIVANLLLIPVFGFIGAVYSSMLMNIVAKFLNYFYLRKAGIFPDLTKYLKPLYIFIIIALFVQLVHIDSIYWKVLLILIYLVTCLVIYKELRSLFGMVVKYYQNLRLKTKTI